MDGYLGVGFDAYGNYTSKTYGGSTCSNPSWASTRDAEQVTIRGPGTAKKGYCLLNSTVANGGLKGSLSAGKTGTRATAQVPVEVVINPTTGTLVSPSGISVPTNSYAVQFTPLHGTTVRLTGNLPADTYLEANDPSWVNSGTGIPKVFAFGFGASTGTSTDNHEVRDVQISPLATNPPKFGLSLTDNDAGALVKGKAVTYTARPVLGAIGGSVGNQLTLTTTFPTGITPGTPTTGNWTCAKTGQTVTCTSKLTLPIKTTTVIPPLKMPATVKATVATATHLTVTSCSARPATTRPPPTTQGWSGRPRPARTWGSSSSTATPGPSPRARR